MGKGYTNELDGLSEEKAAEVLDALDKDASAWADKLGRAAYAGYCKVTGGKKFDGSPVLEYDAMPEHIRKAWEQAGVAAVDTANDITEAEIKEIEEQKQRAKDRDEAEHIADISPKSSGNDGGQGQDAVETGQGSCCGGGCHG